VRALTIKPLELDRQVHALGYIIWKAPLSRWADWSSQRVGIAKANIFGLRGCVVGRWTFAMVSFPLRIMVNGAPTILTVWSPISQEGFGGDPEDVGEVVMEFEEEGVSGIVGIVTEEAVAAVEYERAEEGDGVLEEEIGGGATFVRICWRA
jgi:hypothetical protein